MIDPVIVYRIEAAIRSRETVEFDPPLRDGEAKYYYRELAYLGYTGKQISDATGWHPSRLMADLRARREYRLTTTPDTIAADARQVEVEHRPGAVVIHTPEISLSIDGFPRDLTTFGRLVYGAATDQQESA